MTTKQQKTQMPVVLRCIPISKDLKRYFWSKYQHLRTHSGPKYAAATFKELRQVIMTYVDSPDRIARKEEFIALCPVRKNGWLRKLFLYADTQPHHVLQFLKLYTTEAEPVVSEREAAEKMDQELKATAEAWPETPISYELDEWLWALTHRHYVKDLIYYVYTVGYVDNPVFDGYYPEYTLAMLNATIPRMKRSGYSLKWCFNHFLGYLSKMDRIFTPRRMTDEDALQKVRNHLPKMEDYAFWGKGSKPISQIYDANGIICDASGENPFEEDLMSLFSLDQVWHPATRPIMEVLPDSLTDMADEVNAAEEGMEVVGHIRQIPKKGTVVRRSIADPNKFLQAGLVPFQQLLRSMTNRIPRNCQFDQTKMNLRIRAELDSGFAGSVDLHQATDWLPLRWFEQISDTYFFRWFPEDAHEVSSGDYVPEDKFVVDSFRLFALMARAIWDNEGLESAWASGQPLGTLPSFEILTLTHFAICEALSWLTGDTSSPYALLGDDVVFFNEVVRKNYITHMTEHKIPLSLHKSYENRLTEFAGVLYVENQEPRYASDVPFISWYNLFDYQRATRVVIHYRDLPKDVKGRLVKLASSYHSALRPEDLYTAMQICADVPIQVTQINELIGQLVVNFYSSDPSLPEQAVEGLYGFQFLGHVGTYDDQTRLPTARRKPAKWWKKKVRPETTTAIAARCLVHN
jgi:hypothetical protein